MKRTASAPTPSHCPRLHRVAASLLAFAGTTLLATGGCTLFGIVDEAVYGPTPTPAVFVLPDRVTAVLVDDPDHTLTDPRVPRTIGAIALHHMRFHGAPKTAALVDADQVARIEARLSDDWHTTPIDAIGRSLDAAQVVYARITPIGFDSHRGDRGDGAALRLDVKLIDTQTGARVWPVEAVASPDGYPLVVTTTVAQRRRRLTGQDTPQQTLDYLVDAAGLALGQLFYDWTPPAPGRNLENR